MINHDQYSEPIASDDKWDESLRSQPEKQPECGACTGPDPVKCMGKVTEETAIDGSPIGACMYSFFPSMCEENIKAGTCPNAKQPDPLDVLEQFIKENQRDLNEEEGYEPPMLDVPPFMIIDVDDIMGKIAELRQRGNK